MALEHGSNGQAQARHPGPLLQIRHTLAVNLLKSLLLGPLHKPGDAQGDLIWSYFLDARQDDALELRTWKRWFEPGVRSTQSHKYEVLDRVVANAARKALNDAGESAHWPMTMISSLACQGLVRELLEPTKAATPLHTLSARAADYMPVSPLHLHVDAIEIAALVIGNGDVSWESVKAIAAKRILELIHQRWNRRSGYIYAQLSSNYEVSLQAFDAMLYESERWGKLAPAIAEKRRNSPASPAWGITNIQLSEAPIHAHRLMLALAADVKFLVADRFEAWYLDLATAAIAMFALAWSERKATFGQLRVQDEQIYWRAFDHIFFHESHIALPTQFQSQGTNASDAVEQTDDWESSHPEILSALDLTGARWERSSIDVLLRARAQYRTLLTGLGVSVESIRTTVASSTRVLPVRFVG